MESGEGSSSTTAESCSRCSFEHVELKGRNVGASMSLLPGSAAEQKDSVCINIYVNNNVQGVNNSVMVGSGAKARDGGVRIYLNGLSQRSKKQRSKKKKKQVDDVPAAASGFVWTFVVIVFAYVLFLSFS